MWGEPKFRNADSADKSENAEADFSSRWEGNYLVCVEEALKVLSGGIRGESSTRTFKVDL